MSSNSQSQGGSGLLLGIDSATEYLALSLVEVTALGGLCAGGRQVARFVQPLGREHAARIMGELEALFERAGAARSDVVGVGVGVGPGSYTGVRIGVATALALGRAWSVPVGGSCSLLALLGEELKPGQHGVAILDARKENVYALEGKRAESAGTADDAEHAEGAANTVGVSCFEPVGAPVKLARSEVPQRFPGLPVFEGEPDAAVLARRALANGPVTAYYL